MKTQTGKSTYLPLLITGIAVVLFSTAGIARVMGWGPNSTEDSSGILAPGQTGPVPTASEVRARPRCVECGMIVSMREIESHDEDTGPGAAGRTTTGNRDGMRSYEIIVRMADGSSRVIEQANPARWRTGERLIVIAGTNPPQP